MCFFPLVNHMNPPSWLYWLIIVYGLSKSKSSNMEFPQALDHVRVGDLPSKAGSKKIGRSAHLPDPLYHRGSARADAALRLGASAPGAKGR